MDKLRYYEYIKEDLLASYWNSQSSKNTDFHFHDNYEIFLFLNGKANFFVDQFSYPLHRGNVLVFNKHEIHKLINLSADPYERITIHFSPSLVQSFCTAETNLLFCFQNHRPSVNNMALLNESQLCEFSKLAYMLINTLNQKKYGNDVLSLSYLLQVLVFINDVFRQACATIPSVIPSVIQSVMQYIDSHLHTALTLEQISKEQSLDKYHLSHLFKQQTGGTIYHYVLLKKVALAKQHLAEGRSVSETCTLSGFNDYANFIRTFKNITGISPGRYGKPKGERLI